MASIHREIWIRTTPEMAWSALRDVGALHSRLAVGFVVDVRMESADARVVTFANGLTTRELIVDIDEDRRRLVWSAAGGAMSHHNASAQVFAVADGTRFVWIADLLPHELAPRIAGMIESGLEAIKHTLEASTDAAGQA